MRGYTTLEQNVNKGSPKVIGNIESGCNCWSHSCSRMSIGLWHTLLFIVLHTYNDVKYRDILILLHGMKIFPGIFAETFVENFTESQ